MSLSSPEGASQHNMFEGSPFEKDALPQQPTEPAQACVELIPDLTGQSFSNDSAYTIEGNKRSDGSGINIDGIDLNS